MLAPALRAVFAAAATSVALALAGCATPAPPTPPGVGEQLREWSGRFSVIRSPVDPRAQRESASGRFALTARGGVAAPRPALALALYSPFGQTVATALRPVRGDASLRLHDGREMRAPSLDELLAQALGYTMPVERLPNWLASDFEQVLAHGADGRPREALDSGWRIRLDDGRWSFERDDPAGRVLVRLVLDD